METIKNAIGLGSSTTEQGREPVSGVTGAGTAGEPYDQGNVDNSTLGGKAAQHTDPTTDHSTSPNVTSTSSTGPYTIGTGLGASNSTSTGEVTSSQGVTPNAASATSTTGPAADPTSTNTTAGPHASDLANKADPRVDSDNDRNTSLGGSVPSSNDPMHAHQDIPTDTVGGNSTSTSTAPAHSLAASRASIAPEKPDHTNAPLKPAERGGQHGSNPSAIPLAGGKKIGEDAYTERKSFQADATDSSIPPPAAGMGSETTANTARNVGTAEAAGRSSIGEKESVTSGTGSGHSEGKEKKSLKEKIKEKVHKH